MVHKIFQSFVRVSLLLALSFTGMGSALAAAGDLDPTFGMGGKVTTDFGNSSLININTASAEELEALPCIGPVIAQEIVDYRNQNGPFQTIEGILNVSGVGPGTFNCIKDLITVGGHDLGYAVVVQADGKVIVAGGSSPNLSYADFDFGLARYNSDGSLDASFGNGGTVTTDVGGDHDEGYAVVLQADGKIIVAGSSSTGSDDDFALARYNSDGLLDVNFGNAGKVTTNFGSSDLGTGVALQPDSKIVVVGWVWNGSDWDFALARYNNDGTLDASFGTGGTVTTNFGSNDQGMDVAVQIDGKIVVAGGSGGDFALARYNSDGVLDTTFDGDGFVITDVGGFDGGAAVAVRSDGKIIVAGTSNSLNPDFALARYNTDGSLDATLGAGGLVTTDFGNEDYGEALALQPDGKMVVAGFSGGDFALARYRSDGSLDTSFAIDGQVTTDFSGRDDAGIGVALQPDGRIIVTGRSFNGNDYDFALARYDTDLSIELSINIEPGNPSNRINLRSKGRVLVAILSSPEFDAPSQIDRSSLTFGRSGDEPSLAFCLKRGVDVNHDGLPDLLCQFYIQKAGFQIGDVVGFLRGQTQDGIPIEGYDAVEIRK
jgi:competence ComEA-like helix-hairpin-helix protein